MRTLVLAATAIALLAAPAMAQAPKPAAPAAPAAAPAAAVAPAGAYVMDKTHSSLTWKMQHMGLSWYTARFTDFNIDLTFDPADVTKSKVSATVDPKSIETDFAKTRPAGNTTDFNAELQGDKFLNSTKFPKMTFVSTSIKKTGAKTGKMTGDLTFLGVTKPETFDITYVGNAPDFRPTGKHKVGFSATGSIKRSDFGMPQSPLGDEVKLIIESEFTSK